MVTETLLENLRSNLRRVHVAYKQYSAQTEITKTRDRTIKLAELVILSLSTGGVVSALFISSRALQVVSALMLFVGMFVTTYQYRFRHDDEARQFHEAAQKLWAVRDRYINLISDYCDGSLEDAEARRVRDQLSVQLEAIYSSVSDVSLKAERIGEAALKGDDTYMVRERKIDELLPTAAKRAQNQVAELNRITNGASNKGEQEPAQNVQQG